MLWIPPCLFRLCLSASSHFFSLIFQLIFFSSFAFVFCSYQHNTVYFVYIVLGAITCEMLFGATTDAIFDRINRGVSVVVLYLHGLLKYELLIY